MEILTQPFGAQAISYTLINDHGVALSVTDFGARIVSLRVPLATGERELVLGFDSRKNINKKIPLLGQQLAVLLVGLLGHIGHTMVSITSLKPMKMTTPYTVV